ncbi:Aste57867_15940 [Aphanomyces stellatus]|uniref:Aste57867_15940 protein n=1 Tax=Aphanomyces stellatus TaxID=120398 RepID=A0A485L4B6_9STRA|nr:hypothetical protein As57867_015884 [Aphanomyces stellatus]VFT92726.1 Aste57867_15940 [Aphanomyces stellatus]
MAGDPSRSSMRWAMEDDIMSHSNERGTRSTSPFRSPGLSRPSTADLASGRRRFQPTEPDELALRQQKQQEQVRWRQLLDEQLEEKKMRKDQEIRARQQSEAEQAQQERRYAYEQHIRAQQKLGHVATLPTPPTTKYVSSGGTTTTTAAYSGLNVHATPPPAPTRILPSPSSSSSSRERGVDTTRDLLQEMQAMLDELRFERHQMHLERQHMQHERDVMARERHQVDLDRQQLALDRESLMRERADYELSKRRHHHPPSLSPIPSMPPPNPWTDFDALTLSPKASAYSPTFSPYRDTKSRRRHMDKHDFDDDDLEINPLEQSLACTSVMVPIVAPPPPPLASVDENVHNRRVIQASGRTSDGDEVDTTTTHRQVQLGPRRRVAPKSQDDDHAVDIHVVVGGQVVSSQGAGGLKRL